MKVEEGGSGPVRPGILTGDHAATLKKWQPFYTALSAILLPHKE